MTVEERAQNGVVDLFHAEVEGLEIGHVERGQKAGRFAVGIVAPGMVLRQGKEADVHLLQSEDRCEQSLDE